MKKRVIIKILNLFPIAIKAAPVLFLVTIFTSTIHGIMWGVTTLAQQFFLDDVAGLINGSSVLKTVVLSLIFLGSANLFCHLINGISSFLLDLMDEKVNGVLSKFLHEKVAKLSVIDFEDTGKLNAIEKAELGKENVVKFIAIIEDIFIFYLPYFCFMGIYLYNLKSYLIFSLIGIFIPVVVIQLIRTGIFAKMEDTEASLRRKNQYYESYMVDRRYYKEVRIFGAFCYFNRLFKQTLESIWDLRIRTANKVNRWEFISRMLTAFGYIIILLLLFHNFIKGEISIGSFSAVFTSVTTMYSLMEEMICYQLGGIANNYGTLVNFVDFLELPEKKAIYDKVDWNSVKIENVCFKYPNAENYALKNINLSINKGETIAVVGENGSGKSTLMRVVAGIYNPTEGKVLVNNVSVNDIRDDVLMEKITAVFQNYNKYKVTLEDNIVISQFDKRVFLRDEWKKMFSEVNLDLDKFNDLNLVLAPEFGGVDCSGGEWQKIAILRGMIKNHDFILLDEPTAAIDPNEENLLYKLFEIIMKEKTGMFITHRIGSAKIADRIIVMKEGKIIEEGSHKKLMEKKREYYRLYLLQSQWYD